MTTKWKGEGGMIPNIGAFGTGEVLTDEIVQRLRDAGYSDFLETVADAQPEVVKPTIINTEGV